MLILKILSMHSVLFDFIVYSCGRVLTYNHIIWCQPEEDGFPFEYGFSQGPPPLVISIDIWIPVKLLYKVLCKKFIELM